MSSDCGAFHFTFLSLFDHLHFITYFQNCLELLFFFALVMYKQTFAVRVRVRLCVCVTSRSSCCRSQTTPVSLFTEKYRIASSPETPYMRGSPSGSFAFSCATDEPARVRGQRSETLLNELSSAIAILFLLHPRHAR